MSWRRFDSLRTGWVLASLFLLLVDCREDPVVGKRCDDDAQCGRGFDCFSNRCVQVCTEETDCPSSHRCERYHCVKAPPAPDVTAAELRAIRRELELIRKEQQRLADALEAQ